MKRFGLIGLAILIVLAFLAIRIIGKLDPLVQETIESVGSELTGTDVALKAVSIDLGKGSATLTGLKIANPEGYRIDSALVLNRVSVALDLASLTGPVIVLNEVAVRGVRLNVEQSGTKSNLTELLAQVKANSSKGSDSMKTESADAEPVRLALRNFVFANTEASLESDFEEKRSISVPDIERNNIGTAESGLTPEELGAALLQAVLEEVQGAVAGHLTEQGKRALEDKLREKIGLPGREE